MSRYGYATWQNEWWPTADHIIPWKLFAVLSRAAPRLRAREQLDMAHAVTLGYVGAKVPKDEVFKYKRRLRRLEHFADGTNPGDDD